MKVAEEMEDINQCNDYDEDEYEIDEDYEFDASQFFDFTRTEFDSEIEEAEHWFEVSGDYPPSPFIIKLNLEKVLSDEAAAKHRSLTKSSVVSTSNQNVKGQSHHYQTLEEDGGGSNSDTNPSEKPRRSSTFMKPTASHLAKQRSIHQRPQSHVCTRFQRTSSKLDAKKLSSPAGSDNLASKRQKLETGYLKKIAQLRHQFTLQHKSSKKVTVPKEPALETMIRAQSMRSKNSSMSSGTEKQERKGCNIEAVKKLKDVSNLPHHKKSTPQLPKFKVFHLKTLERAKHHASAKVHPSGDYADDLQAAKQKPTTLKHAESRASHKLLERATMDQFTKLSLGSETMSDDTSHLNKASSESYGMQRYQAKRDLCGDKYVRAHEVDNVVSPTT